MIKTHRFIKRTLASVVVVLVMMACGAPQARAWGEKSLGVSLGYLTKNHSAIGGVHFDYRLMRPLRLSLDAQYIFRHKGTDAYDFNFNLEIPFGFGPVTLYPLAGVGIWSWNKSHYDPVTDDDSSQRTTRMSFNLGAGVDYRIKRSMKLTLRYLEAFAGHHYGTGSLQIGVAYIF